MRDQGTIAFRMIISANQDIWYNSHIVFLIPSLQFGKCQLMIYTNQTFAYFYVP